VEEENSQSRLNTAASSKGGKSKPGTAKSKGKKTPAAASKTNTGK